MVKHVSPKTWRLFTGGDGRMRSADQYGLVGNGLSVEEVATYHWQAVVREAQKEEEANQRTMQETRELLLAQVRAEQLRTEEPFALLLQTEIVKENDRVSEGTIVTAASISWRVIFERLRKDPRSIEEFARYPRKFEEFIAAAYDKDGWEVTLTPRSGDRGRDVIAVKKGFGSLRFLEQTKAYSPGHLVSHDDVRAMLGVLHTDPNSSKGLITTTSDFQPEVRKGKEFAAFMPHRLELKNGKELMDWLDSIANKQCAS